MASSSQPQPLEFNWKNRLQEFTQKASMPLPTYKTCYEGLPHAPQFRSRVCVDGTCFDSPNIFSSRKMAEQDAAKHAYIGTVEKVKNESASLAREDTLFCKMIMNEYALKMNWLPPTYIVNEAKTIFSIFISSLVLNGATYTGGAAKTKKEAEQLAARSAILSIIESEAGTTMSEIVKSKFKFYDALKKAKELSTKLSGVGPTEDSGIISSVKEVDDSACNVVTTPIAPIPESGLLISSVNKRKEVDEKRKEVDDSACNVVTTPIAPIPESGLLISSVNKRKEVDDSACNIVTHPVAPLPQSGLLISSVNKRKEVDDSACNIVTHPVASIPQSGSLSFPISQIMHPELNLEQSNRDTHHPVHEFKKPKAGNTTEVAQTPAPPIEFVPPSLEQGGISSNSGKKKNKKKKKAKKKMEYPSSLLIAAP